MQKILIIEDDPAIRDELSLLLKNEGYSTLAPGDFTDIPVLAAQYTPDLLLLARIKAVLRRTGKAPAPSDIMEYGGLRLNLTKGTVSVNIKMKIETAVLTRNELQILACLISHAGEIVSRADLIETLWDNQIYIDDNTLSVNVTRLRGKLARLGFPDFIKTRRGMGYQLEIEYQPGMRCQP